MHRRSLHTIAASLTSLSLLFTMMGTTLAVDSDSLSATGLTPDGEPIQAAKSRSGALARTDPALLGRNDTTPVPVFIKLDYDAVASYAGGMDDLAATSPAATGKPLKANRAAVDAYLGYVAEEDAAARAAIEAAVPQSTVLDSYTVAYGGLNAVVPASTIGSLLAVEGVMAVQQDSLEQPLTDAPPVTRTGMGPIPPRRPPVHMSTRSTCLAWTAARSAASRPVRMSSGTASA